MIFEYPNYGGSGVRVDTESITWLTKVRFVANVIGAKSWKLKISPITYPFPGAGQQFVITPALSVIFEVDAAPTEMEGTVSCDAAGIELDPQASANSLLYCLHRPMSAPKYVGAGDEKPVKPDWEVVGSKIGPPMYASFFQFKNTGEPIGTRVTGPSSGALYELVMLPGLFAAQAWKKL